MIYNSVQFTYTCICIKSSFLKYITLKYKILPFFQQICMNLAKPNKTFSLSEDIINMYRYFLQFLTCNELKPRWTNNANYLQIPFAWVSSLHNWLGSYRTNVYNTPINYLLYWSMVWFGKDECPASSVLWLSWPWLDRVRVVGAVTVKCQWATTYIIRERSLFIGRGADIQTYKYCPPPT